METTALPAETTNPLPDITPELAEAAYHFSPLSTLSHSRRDRLENWHRHFLLSASGTITDLLRLKMDFELDSIEIQTYGQFLQDRGDDHHSFIFRMHPEPGIWFFDLPLPFSLGIIERLMGSSELATTETKRDLTDLEETILQQFAEIFLHDYTRQWQPQAVLEAEVLRQARNLRLQKINPPNDLMLRVKIKALVGAGHSLLVLLIPIASIEDLLLRLSPQAESGAEESLTLTHDESPLGSVPVPVSIRWQGFQITLGEVDSMSPGDVLMLENKKCENVVVWLGDIPKFQGHVVRTPDKTTITLTGHLE